MEAQRAAVTHKTSGSQRFARMAQVVLTTWGSWCLTAKVQMVLTSCPLTVEAESLARKEFAQDRAVGQGWRELMSRFCSRNVSK